MLLKEVQDFSNLLGIGSKKLTVVGIGGGAWGSVFVSLLQRKFANTDLLNIKIYRRPGRVLTPAEAGNFINLAVKHPELARTLSENGSFSRYFDCLSQGADPMTADGALAHGFCLNLPDSVLDPLQVVTSLEDALVDADIIINGLPSTETYEVFAKMGPILKARNQPAIVISLAKGVDSQEEDGIYRIITPCGQIHQACPSIPRTHIFYLGGPNIAAELWQGEYATARLCGGNDSLRLAVTNLFRQRNFVIWPHRDAITHEVTGALKNCYAIGMGLTESATNGSATSKSVYFSSACSEMFFISHLFARRPHMLSGPLMADTYVTLMKGRNAWYGQELGKGRLEATSDNHVIPGKGQIQGISAVKVLVQILSQPVLKIKNRLGQPCVPIDMLPTLSAIHQFLFGQPGKPLPDKLREFLVNGVKLSHSVDPAESLFEAMEAGKFYFPFLSRIRKIQPECPPDTENEANEVDKSFAHRRRTSLLSNLGDSLKEPFLDDLDFIAHHIDPVEFEKQRKAYAGFRSGSYLINR